MITRRPNLGSAAGMISLLRIDMFADHGDADASENCTVQDLCPEDIHSSLLLFYQVLTDLPRRR
ncbi:uncharacterized protein G6M90_00g084690 [Metarhizium brunneum]|uniref:Uncharacterized protein n=1 Tax=Metarhizium brunneum TaxID=500148 RepID=A0A7D5V0V7_9HYPO|nr:hypothetical protein G6M90_00g084690 [Metarhizium brunneum]